VLIVLARGSRLLHGVPNGGQIDPENYMCLVRLRETLLLHRPAYTVAGHGPGDGTLVRWSHLLDRLVCLLATPLGLVLGSMTALQVAAVLAEPISIGALGCAVAWTAASSVPAWLRLVAADPASGNNLYRIMR